MSKRKAKLIAVIDSETDPFLAGNLPRPFVWGLYYESPSGGLLYRHFEGEHCTYALMDFIANHLSGFLIYAHNGGKFDFHFILEHISEFDTPLRINLINSRIAKLKFFDNEFRDSFLILPVRLAATGDKLQFDYWKLWDSVEYLTPEELRQFARDRRKAKANAGQSPREYYRSEILEYLEQDCVALYDNVKAFIERFGVGLTLANRSFNEMAKVGLKAPHSNRYRDEQLRPWFFGGRCQAFEFGKIEGDILYLDINSAYPYAMLSRHFWGCSFDCYSSGFERIPAEYQSNCLLEISCKSQGAFPVRTSKGISYPEAEGIYKVTGWEFQAARELGLIRDCEIIRYIVPHETENFEPFILKFYEDKLDAEKRGDKQARLFAKLLMNSGFGRFAMNPDKWRENALTRCYDGAPPIDEKEKNQNPWEIVNRMENANLDVFERAVSQEQMRYYSVGTAASITGYVRAMLMRAIAAVRRPLYCDTDSIMFENAGEAFPLGDQLGQWSVEATGPRLWVGGKKLYAFEQSDGSFKLASKGVSLDADSIKRIAEGNLVKWKNFAPTYSLKNSPKFIERNIGATCSK